MSKTLKSLTDILSAVQGQHQNYLGINNLSLSPTFILLRHCLSIKQILGIVFILCSIILRYYAMILLLLQPTIMSPYCGIRGSLCGFCQVTLSAMDEREHAHYCAGQAYCLGCTILSVLIVSLQSVNYDQLGHGQMKLYNLL